MPLYLSIYLMPLYLSISSKSLSRIQMQNDKEQLEHIQAKPTTGTYPNQTSITSLSKPNQHHEPIQTKPTSQTYPNQTNITSLSKPNQHHEPIQTIPTSQTYPNHTNITSLFKPNQHIQIKMVILLLLFPPQNHPLQKPQDTEFLNGRIRIFERVLN